MSKLVQNKRIDTLTTAFGKIKSIPDPASIVTTWQWYFLSHISSPLIRFDHLEGRFVPLLAKEWEIDGLNYTFTLKDNIYFNDGSPISAFDVEASIKRLILKRTSTHFPVWEYFSNCEKLSSIRDACDGIQVLSPHKIKFTLNSRLESFFLLMCSPEGGVWSTKDISLDGSLVPKHFSGPYWPKDINEDNADLSLNESSPLIQAYPEAPRAIKIYFAANESLEKIMSEKKVDIYIEASRPFQTAQYEQYGLVRKVSSFNTIFYLYKTTKSTNRVLGRDFITSLWAKLMPDEMAPSETFLPFGSLGALNRESFLRSLPEYTSKNKIRIAVLSPYFDDKLIKIIDDAATENNLNFEFIRVDFNTWVGLFNQSEENAKLYDFVLSPYVASERFPSVQIKFLLEGVVPPISLKNLDLPDSSPERIRDLIQIQKWMLAEQIVIPLLFVRNHVIYRPEIDIGDQPITDAELQLWRAVYK